MPLETSLKIHKMTEKKIKSQALCLKLTEPILIEMNLQISAQAPAPALRGLLRCKKKQPVVWQEGS